MAQPILAASGDQGIAQQASNGHRADAAWNRRDRTGDFHRLLEGDIADQAHFPGMVVAQRRDPVNTDIDDRRTRLDPIPAHHLGASGGGDSDYREGLDLGIHTLKEVLTRYQNLGGADMVRYGLSMLFLSRKLEAKRGMMEKVGETLEEIKAQIDESGPTELPIITALSRCYQETLSTFRFRIHVQGDGRYLQDQEIADQIRAVLLAGVRAAILWRQVGGRRWHLLLYRNRIHRALNEIA